MECQSDICAPRRNGRVHHAELPHLPRQHGLGHVQHMGMGHGGRAAGVAQRQPPHLPGRAQQTRERPDAGAQPPPRAYKAHTAHTSKKLE
ncbi:hypothetical protein RWV98_05195 [Agathobaculum sp. NTUH-O15-33]|uniref:hypothetical protein n=1 Tax=Agathobaculum sp. NTUH-O15-33 TaxID=3079302 RepID=UPI00295870B3|nr:hypothetical protein [Agathobaculum sp. NTUH-O15-33]WNX85672.1 hypothetical protein RWV98_05195 [Agathobaculum sp. NTUH-O15-33]